MTLLARHSTPELVRRLSQISNTLHRDFHSGHDSHAALMQKYGSLSMQVDMQRDVAAGIPTVLFHRCSAQLLDELLRINTISVPLDFSYLPYTIEEHLFLYANTLIAYLEADPPVAGITSYSEKAKLFYSRQSIDRVAAIGRAKMYEYGDFPDNLGAIGIETEEYFKAISSLCFHVEKEPFIQLEFPKSIKTLPTASQKIITKYAPLLSIKMQSVNWDLATLESKLPELYFTDALCRETPLLQIEDRYYCLQPRFLWTSLADLPYYLLLKSHQKKAANIRQKAIQTLGAKWGEAFQTNFKKLGSRAFGPEKCKGYNCQNLHPEFNLTEYNPIGDFFVDEDRFRVIAECKGKQPTLQTRLGNREEARSRFINIGSEGVPQLTRDAKVYRKETGYTGNIYIALAFRGPIPATTDFDNDLQSYLNASPDYQEYITSPNNKPLIYLDAFSAELLFSAIRQGLEKESILDKLSGLPPSQVSKVIVTEITQKNLKNSLKPLYEEETQKFLCKARSMYGDY